MHDDPRFRFDAALIPGMRERLHDSYKVFRAVERRANAANAPSAEIPGPGYHDRACPCCGAPPPDAVQQSANGIDVVLCPACGLAYAQHVMDETADRLRYKASDLDEASLALRTSEPYLELEIARSDYYLDVLSAAGATGGALLEIGCGTGTFALRAQERGWATLGLDPGRSAVAVARSRGVAAVEGYFPEDLPRKDQAFDVVAMLDVLEHLEDPKPLLATIRGYQAPDGLLFVQVPNYDSLLVRLEGSESSIICPGHWSYFTPQTLRRLMQAAGFRTVRVETVVSEIDRIAAFSPVERARALASLRPGVDGDVLDARRLLDLELGYKLIGVFSAVPSSALEP